MGIFDSVKNFVFVQEETENESKPSVQAPVVKTPVVPEAPKPFVPPVIGQADPNIVSLLEEAIQEGNVPGFDYLELKAALVGLSAIPIPEEQKIQTAFISNQPMGAKKEDIINSFAVYIGIVEKKKGEFLLAVEEQIKNEVTSREEAIQKLDASMQEASAKIQELTLAIQQKNEEKLKISSELFTAKQKIQNTASAFDASCKQVVDKLNADKAKIESALK